MTTDSGSSTSSTETPVELPNVPGYILKSVVAQYGRSIVYRAVDSTLHKEVAIEVLSFASPGEDVVANFNESARIVAQLNHPGIPSVWKIGALADKRPFLIMTLVEGETLEQLLSRRVEPRLDYMRFIPFFEKLCQTMAYVHSRRVIHGNLKPRNVVLGPFGDVVVTNWDLAVREADDMSGSTAQIETISFRGTPAYMPPEQARADSTKFSCRSDVFTLGGILTEILTGSAPFHGPSTLDLVKNSAAGDLSEAFARLGNCGADPELAALAKRCLNPDPGQRPANAGELASSLASFRLLLEERLRKSESEQLAAAVVLERGKKRQLLLAFTLVVGLFVLWSMAFFWWYDRQAAKWRLLHGSPAEEKRTAEDGKKERVPSPKTKELQEKLKQLRRTQMDNDAAARMKQNRVEDLPPAVYVAPPPREINKADP